MTISGRNFTCDALICDVEHLDQNGTPIFQPVILSLLIVFLILIDYIVNPV